MRKAAILPILFCIAFGDPNAVTWFVNHDLQPPRHYKVIAIHDQYQIFYEADEAFPIWTCPNTAECVFVPQGCR